MSAERRVKIAIIQMTRMGDILQTCLAAKQITDINKDVDLHLIAREELASPLDFILKKTFKKTHFINTEEILKGDQLEDSLNEISNQLRSIEEESFDLIVNASFCNFSKFLSKFLGNNKTIGLTLLDGHHPQVTGSWAQYTYATTMSSGLSHFNLVDTFRGLLDSKAKVSLSEQNKTPKITDSQKILIHPFSSETKKTWSLGSWADLINKILKNNPKATITIVGSKDEIKKSEPLVTSMSRWQSRFKSLVGQTTIEKLYQEIKNSNLLIAQDSMVSHLAAFTQIPILSLALGPVRPWETAPYSQNSIVVSPRISCHPCPLSKRCEGLECFDYIEPNLLSAIANLMLEQDYPAIERFLSTKNLNKVEIQIGLFDELGHYLSPIKAENSTLKDIFFTYLRTIFASLLSEKDIDCPAPQITFHQVRELETYLQGIEHLIELNQFSLHILDQMYSFIRNGESSSLGMNESAAKLAEIDQLSTKLKTPYPLLSSLIDYFFIKKSFASSSTLHEVIEENLVISTQQKAVLEILSSFIRQTIQNYKLNRAPRLTESSKA